jgi:hypothetical protein
MFSIKSFFFAYFCVALITTSQAFPRSLSAGSSPPPDIFNKDVAILYSSSTYSEPKVGSSVEAIREIVAWQTSQAKAKQMLLGRMDNSAQATTNDGPAVGVTVAVIVVVVVGALLFAFRRFRRTGAASIQQKESKEEVAQHNAFAVPNGV